MAGGMNEPFNERNRNAIGPNGRAQTIQRGWIIEDTSSGTSTHSGGARKFAFYFNPGNISTSYAMDAQEQDINLTAAMDPRDKGTYRILTNQRLTFQLMFDRNAEVAAGDTDGAWKDAKALLALVGIEDSIDGVTVGTIQNQTTTGLMMFTPVWFWFGQSSPLKFYGVIESAGIDYTHFNAKQIPYRCVMSIQARLLPKTAVNIGVVAEPAVGQGSVSPAAADYRDSLLLERTGN